MSKSSKEANSSAKALRKLEAYGVPFTGEAFLHAIVERDLEKLGLFMEAGIDVNQVVDGVPPIVWLASVHRANCQIAQLLIDNGADVNAVSGDGVNAIGMALCTGHKDLARLLIANGVDVNAVQANGLTLLAMQADRKEMAQFLIENGADANAEIAPGSAALERREITNIVERLELLEEKFGIEISGLYASCYYQSNGTPPWHEVIINFDVTSLSGGVLERNLKISASAYNPTGQLLGTTSSYISIENFMGFSPISITSHLDQEPAKIRLFPAAYD